MYLIKYTKQLENDKNSWVLEGNIYDEKRDMFIKHGYGAMMFQCGEHQNLDEVLMIIRNYGMLGILTAIQNGAELTIGPGFSGKGNAIYCKNYIEMLAKELIEDLTEQEKKHSFNQSSGGRK